MWVDPTESRIRRGWFLLSHTSDVGGSVVGLTLESVVRVVPLAYPIARSSVKPLHPDAGTAKNAPWHKVDAVLWVSRQPGSPCTNAHAQVPNGLTGTVPHQETVR